MNKDNEVSDIASSCKRTKKTKLVREKKSTRYESEKLRTEIKMAEKFTTRDLDERLIAEVAKRVGGVRGFYSMDRVAAAMEGIVKTPFIPELDKKRGRTLHQNRTTTTVIIFFFNYHFKTHCSGRIPLWF